MYYNENGIQHKKKATTQKHNQLMCPIHMFTMAEISSLVL